MDHENVAEFKSIILCCIEADYNRVRKYPNLNEVSPVQFENEQVRELKNSPLK